MVSLLGERDRRFLAADADLQSCPTRVDGEVLVPQPAHQVEGFPWRLLAREPQRIGRHCRLDRGSHLRGRAEEAIGGCQALERLVRSLEVVVLHEERASPLAIVEVGEYRARQELLPHRLPEALDLAAGLRVVRAALHVRDAVAPELLLEGRGATPSGVLPPLVGEDLARSAIVGDAARERLHHERALLVVRHHQTHEIARVVVHEGRHIDALVPAQEEREEIRLPQLIRLGSLESPRARPRAWLGRRRLAPPRQALFLEHPAHRRLRCSDAEEALHHIANAPASRLWLRALHRHDQLAARISLARLPAALAAATRTRLQCRSPTRSILLHPFVQRRVRNPQLARYALGTQPLIHDHRGGRHHHVDRPRCAGFLPGRVPANLLSSIRIRSHSVHSFRAARSTQSEVEC